MTPYHVLARALTGPLTLTHSEAAALATHADLLADLHLLTHDTRIEPGGRFALGVLGTGLMSQLADLDEPHNPPAPGM